MAWVDTFTLPSEAETVAFGEQLSKVLKPPMVIFLQGELGSGKTTLVRGFLRGLGLQGTARSPTYTLVENYKFLLGPIYHFDLYRLANPEELEWMGIRDYFTEDAIIWIEWPERGGACLPTADIKIELSIIPAGRLLTLTFLNEQSLAIRSALSTVQSSK